MACSSNKVFSKGDDDNMSWTGKIDKFVFKLLTTNNDPLVMGRKTYDALPSLPGRKLLVVSRLESLSLVDGSSVSFVSLEKAFSEYPDAWFIGGRELALAALEKDMITMAYICRLPVFVSGGVDGGDLIEVLEESKKSKSTVSFKSPEYKIDVDIYDLKKPSW